MKKLKAEQEVADRLAHREASFDRDAYRARAIKAEQEVTEWKRRFDALLARTHPEPKEGSRGDKA